MALDSARVRRGFVSFSITLQELVVEATEQQRVAD